MTLTNKQNPTLSAEATIIKELGKKSLNIVELSNTMQGEEVAGTYYINSIMFNIWKYHADTIKSFNKQADKLEALENESVEDDIQAQKEQLGSRPQRDDNIMFRIESLTEMMDDIKLRADKAQEIIKFLNETLVFPATNRLYSDSDFKSEQDRRQAYVNSRRNKSYVKKTITK